MHTPDGFLSNWVCVVTFLITLGMVGISLARAKRWMTKEKAFLMAALAAIIFAFQMLNFSVGNGTSGHLIGAAIAAIMLGPHAAVLVMSAVLVVQTFVYGDGGVFALGANILLMGIVAAYTAHFTYQGLKERLPVIGGMLASWASVIAASLVAALLLGLSGTVAFIDVIPAMVLTHIFIGAGEALITGSVLMYTKRILHAENLLRHVAISTFGALVILSLALPFASGSPDGLEKVAINLGFFERSTELYALAPMPDYTLLGESSYVFVLLSGVVGMALTFGVGYSMARPLST